MAYKRRRKSKSGFKKYCSIKLSSIRKARTAKSRNSTVKSYQRCLNRKGIKTGLKESKKSIFYKK